MDHVLLFLRILGSQLCRIMKQADFFPTICDACAAGRKRIGGIATGSSCLQRSDAWNYDAV